MTAAELAGVWEQRARQLQQRLDENPSAHDTWRYTVSAEREAYFRCANELRALVKGA